MSVSSVVEASNLKLLFGFLTYNEHTSYNVEYTHANLTKTSSYWEGIP